MDHHDHVALIRAGMAGAGARWLELGAGEGAFTLALANVLGDGARIVVLDRDGPALARNAAATQRHFPGAMVEAVVGDFTSDLPAGPFDGVLAANSLHFVREVERRRVLDAVRERLAPGGRLQVVEYDADRGNPWVPHPFSFATWREEARRAGFTGPELTGRVPSRFLGAIYGAVAMPEADRGS